MCVFCLHFEAKFLELWFLELRELNNCNCVARVDIVRLCYWLFLCHDRLSI